MPFPVLNDYLARLSTSKQPNTSVWRDAEGRALGRFFNCTMTSAFQAVRALDSDSVIAYEGFARSVSKADAGLSLWKLLDHAASDDESVELDRLCRMLHAINFFRQSQAPHRDLFLSVHDRLLSAVSSNHGTAFRRIVDALGLPLGRIVLQLPQMTAHQGWLLDYVSDNYRRNGFRFAVNAGSAHEALMLLDRVRPDVIKLDARALSGEDAIGRVVALCHERDVRVVFKRLDTESARATLRRVGSATLLPIFAQGYLLDTPGAALLADGQRHARAPALA